MQNIHTITLISNRIWQKVINFSSRSTFYRTLAFRFERIGFWATAFGVKSQLFLLYDHRHSQKKIRTRQRKKVPALIVTAPIWRKFHTDSCADATIVLMIFNSNYENIRWHGVSPLSNKRKISKYRFCFASPSQYRCALFVSCDTTSRFHVDQSVWKQAWATEKKKCEELSKCVCTYRKLHQNWERESKRKWVCAAYKSVYVWCAWSRNHAGDLIRQFGKVKCHSNIAYIGPAPIV